MSHSRLDGDLTAKSERCWPMSVVGSSRVKSNAISGRRALAHIRRQRDSRVGCLRHRGRVESPMCPPSTTCTYTCLISIVRTSPRLSSPSCDQLSKSREAIDTRRVRVTTNHGAHCAHSMLGDIDLG